ncbi:MAG: endonuclease/exonuclease/phosphatase family protein [Phycisphaerales bacterium]
MRPGSPGGHRIRRLCAALATVACVMAPALFTTPASAQMRVVTWNVAKLAGNQNAIRDVMEYLVVDDVDGYAVAPDILILQEVQNGQASTLRSLMQQAAPPGVTYAIATYTNFNEDGVAGAQALLYRSDRVTEITSGHRDIASGAGRRADRWQMRWLDADPIEGTVWIYGMHLKASPGGSNEAQRQAGADAIRDDAETLPDGSNVLYAGDMNLYTSSEPAFGEFLSAGVNQAYDVLGPGDWTGPANAIKHSQSPVGPTGGALVGGGIDDRFDFILPTIALDDADGIAIIGTSYRSVGNDGNHYNQAINTGNNFYFPGDVAASNDLADALTQASDHVPVLVDFQIPAVMDVTLAPTFGPVIQGGPLLIPASVQNGADVEIPAGSENLFVEWTTSGALLSGGGAFFVEPLGPAQSLTVLFDTGTPGVVNGSLNLSSPGEGVKDADRSVNVTGTVLRPAAASFAAGAPVTTRTIELDTMPDTGPLPIDVLIFNAGWDAMQARLDADSIDNLGGEFVLAGGLPGNITNSGVLPLAFPTDGVTLGLVERTLTINLSDEDLPNASDSTLELILRITVGGDTNPFDLDDDGLVGFGDLLVALAAWGECPNGDPCAADFDENGFVDFGDLLSLLAAFGS